MGNIYLGKGERSKNAPMEPVCLYKKVNLQRDRATDEITLRSVAFASEAKGFAMNEKAECLAVGERGLNIGVIKAVHGESPNRACRCGFYAYARKDKAFHHRQLNDGSADGKFMVKVIASGKMFEYQDGYRYGHQRVAEIIPSLCGAGNCFSFADRIGYQGSMVYPLCADHAHMVPRQSLRSFDELGEVASISLPDGAPRIKVRSYFDHVQPWVSPREKSKRMEKREMDRKEAKVLRKPLDNRYEVILPYLAGAFGAILLVLGILSLSSLYSSLLN